MANFASRFYTPGVPESERFYGLIYYVSNPLQRKLQT